MASPLTKAQLQALVQLAYQQQQLNQQSQTPPGTLYGQHWQSSSQIYGSPAVGTSIGPGGSGSRGSFVASVGTGHFAYFPIDTGPSPTIPYAGIRTGEIIGHRLWWVVDVGGQLRLCSYVHRYLWMPGEAVYGDVSKMIPDAGVWGGTYAYSTPELCNKETDSTRQMIMGGSSWFGFLGGPAGKQYYVQGTIKMWGDVVEHDGGFRAEYAKPHTLTSIWGMDSPGSLEQRLYRLRKDYGLLPDMPLLGGEEPKPIDSGDWTGR